MRKSPRIFLSVLGALFLIVSFPVRELLDSSLLSDVCRIIGFILLFIIIIDRFRKKRN